MKQIFTLVLLYLLVVTMTAVSLTMIFVDHVSVFGVLCLVLGSFSLPGLIDEARNIG